MQPVVFDFGIIKQDDQNEQILEHNSFIPGNQSHIKQLFDALQGKADLNKAVHYALETLGKYSFECSQCWRTAMTKQVWVTEYLLMTTHPWEP